MQSGRRGAGLGNEVFALAKAHIAAEVTGARLVEQPWLINPRQYWRVLGPNLALPVYGKLASPLLDVVDLPFEALADPWNYRAAMEALAPRLPARYELRHTSGMAGGYLAIDSARDFLQRRLAFPAAPTRKGSPAQPVRIGVHMRLGDFQPGRLQPGVFNVRTPVEWTTSAVTAIIAALERPAEVVLHTDGKPRDPDLRQFRGALADHRVRLQCGGMLADLASLARSDVVVPSVSAFSTLALFLGDAPYVWPADHLNRHGRWASLWGHEDAVAAGPTAAAIREVTSDPDKVHPQRAHALPGTSNRGLRSWLVDALSQEGPWPWYTDPIRYGVIGGL